MPQYSIVSLVDITRTNPNRNDTDQIKLSQQANFNSLIQAIGMRSNVDWTQDPTKHQGALPYPFDGRGTYWTWWFSVEREDVFLDGNDPVALLKQDLQNVPIISGLEESIDIVPSIFQTGINVHVEVKV